MITKIGDVCSFINGDRSKNYPSSTEFIESGIPFINAGHIENQRISFDNMNYISEKKYNSLKSGKVKIGDVLFCLRGSLGKNAVVDFENDAAIASSLVIIRPNQSLIKSEYISIYFNSLLFKNKLMKLNNGSSQPNLSAASIKSIEISVPDMKKQNEIINKLLVTKELIDKQMEELELLNELVRARFVEMFGEIEDCDKWESKIWNEVVTIKNGRDYKKVLVSDGGYPVVGTGGEIARASKYLCPENTIVVGRKGSINNPMLMKEKFWNVDTAFGVIPNSDYLHYQYFYCFCKFYNFMKLNKATTLPSTTKADLLKIRINIPPLELQNQFASFVEEIDKSRSRIQKSLEASQELFDSLMQEYFG